MAARAPGFFTAAFAVDGEPAGTGYWETGQLSPKWLGICDQHLQQHGASFNTLWAGNLSHIRTRFTSSSGVALVTMTVQTKAAASLLLLASGCAPEAASEVTKVFVESLRRVNLVKQAAASAEPFQKIFALRDRPLMVVVPWPDEAISEQDEDLMTELSTHLAGAFFNRNPPTASNA